MRTLEPLCASCATDDPAPVYKDVVIVGNGPSGLCLSYILSGRWPYYNGQGHTDLMLQARLQASPRNLLAADLPFLAQGVEGRGSAVGSLMDQLLHPGADQGVDTPPLVDWRHHKPIDHVVIGKHPPGGVWQTMDRNVLTLSLSSWMELPGLSYEQWEGGGESSARRVPAGMVAKYYRDYVNKTKIAKYMKKGEVTLVTPHKEGETGSPSVWRVEGVDAENNSFTYITRSVVLATGTSDVPNRLSVPGESDFPYIHHDLRSLELELERLAEQPLHLRGSVLVVGAGLSAADAILAARFRRLNVIHVFRHRPGSSVDQRILPVDLYPEYTKVKQMMSSEVAEEYPGYRAVAESCVSRFGSDGTVTVRLPTGKSIQVQVCLAAVLIGSRPSLAYIQQHLGAMAEEVDKKHPLAVEPWSHQVEGAGPGLYALGPLAGENFVRYLVGGAIGAAQHIIGSA